MTDDDFSGVGPFVQTMTLRGNVFVQNSLPGNHSQIVALYNDTGLANLSLSLRMLYNTYVGANTNSALVHVSNADGTAMKAEVSDTIIYGTRTPVLIENLSAATISGLNNWIQTNAPAGPLTGSIVSPTPGFRNPTLKDFTLTNGSACIGAASSSVFGLPGKEYFQNETTNRLWRIRPAARDIGAFESSTTGPQLGPYEPPPSPYLSIISTGNAVAISWPLFAQDFHLYHSDFSLPLAWRLAPYPYATNSASVQATPSDWAVRDFFRLQK